MTSTERKYSVRLALSSFDYRFIGNVNEEGAAKLKNFVHKDPNTCGSFVLDADTKLWLLAWNQNYGGMMSHAALRELLDSIVSQSKRVFLDIEVSPSWLQAQAPSVPDPDEERMLDDPAEVFGLVWGGHSNVTFRDDLERARTAINHARARAGFTTNEG